MTLERSVDVFFKAYSTQLTAARQKVKPLLDARLKWEQEQERIRLAEEAAERKRIADAQLAAAAALESAAMPSQAADTMAQAEQTEAHAARLEAKSEGKKGGFAYYIF